VGFFCGYHLGSQDYRGAPELTEGATSAFGRVRAIVTNHLQCGGTEMVKNIARCDVSIEGPTIATDRLSCTLTAPLLLANGTHIVISRAEAHKPVRHKKWCVGQGDSPDAPRAFAFPGGGGGCWEGNVCVCVVDPPLGSSPMMGQKRRIPQRRRMSHGALAYP
jgi:hypothetical protein